MQRILNYCKRALWSLLEFVEYLHNLWWNLLFVLLGEITKWTSVIITGVEGENLRGPSCVGCGLMGNIFTSIINTMYAPACLSIYTSSCHIHFNLLCCITENCQTVCFNGFLLIFFIFIFVLSKWFHLCNNVIFTTRFEWSRSCKHVLLKKTFGLHYFVL